MRLTIGNASQKIAEKLQALLIMKTETRQSGIMLDGDELTQFHSAQLSSAAATVTHFFVKAHSLAFASFYAKLSAVPKHWIPDCWNITAPCLAMRCAQSAAF
jgi:hypothetical protein